MLPILLTNKFVVGAIILFIVLLLLPQGVARHIPGVLALQNGFENVFTTVYSGVVNLIDRGVSTFQQAYNLIKEFLGWTERAKEFVPEY